MLLLPEFSARILVATARSALVLALAIGVAYLYAANDAADLSGFYKLDALQELVAAYTFAFVSLIAAPKLRKGDVTTLTMTLSLCFVFGEAMAGLQRGLWDVAAAVLGPSAMFLTTWTNQLRAAARDRSYEPLMSALDHAGRRKRDWVRRSEGAKKVADIISADGKSESSTPYQTT